MWDVAVVGAGPAGSVAALSALRRDPSARVLLLDRADFPRDKACGDGVAPHVLDVLASLGVPDLLADRAPVRTLELSRGGLTTARPMARAAYVVPRTVLDARLVHAAVDAGAELRRHRVRDVTVHPDRVVLDDRVEARVVVAADGAHSLLRRHAGLPPARRRAVALRGYRPTPPPWRDRQVIRFGQVRQPSYAWAFDRGDGWCNVGYGEVLHRSGAAPTRQGMLAALDDLLPGGTEDVDDWRGHHLPLSGLRWRQPAGRILLAGDAAGLVNPMTGEGIYYAVATGALAGRTAVGAGADGDPGAAHRRRVRGLLATHLATTATVSSLLPVAGILPAGLRAAGASQGVFDDLVELGLGRGLLTGRVLSGLSRELVRPGRA
jgi:menaquinone-9 beta-reductase